MVNASVIRADLAHGALNDVFRNHRLAFRDARAKELDAARVCSVSMVLPSAGRNAAATMG